MRCPGFSARAAEQQAMYMYTGHHFAAITRWMDSRWTGLHAAAVQSLILAHVAL